MNNIIAESDIPLDKLNKQCFIKHCLKENSYIIKRFILYRNYVWYKGIITKITDTSYTVHYFYDNEKKEYNFEKTKNRNLIILSDNNLPNIIKKFTFLKIPLKSIIQFSLKKDHYIQIGILIDYEIIGRNIIYIVRIIKNSTIQKICLINTYYNYYYNHDIYTVDHLIVKVYNYYLADNIFVTNPTKQLQENEFENIEQPIDDIVSIRSNQIDG